MNIQEQDCAICLQKCHHPTRLPCGHIFCFLCVKGVAIQSKRCAMCRAEIPADYLDHPDLLEKNIQQQTLQDEIIENNYQWYYEGRNGWWKYDERSNDELETAFSANEADCSLLLAGAVYTIDFQSMIQIRRNDPTRRRRVRRDTPTLPAKGVAGIKNFDIRPSEQIKANSEAYTIDLTSTPEINEVIVIEDDETTNESVESNSSSDVVHVLSMMSLVESVSPSDIDTTEHSDDT